jgi:hypothetical protein
MSDQYAYASAPSAPPASYDGGSLYPPPSYDPLQHALFSFANQFNIAPQHVNMLRQMIGKQVAIICDDSGSMSNATTSPSLFTGNFLPNDPFAPRRTRFDEVKEMMMAMIQIVCAMDPDGVDIYFLNRDDAKNVTNPADVAQLFAVPPNGYTPLVKTFNRVMADNMSKLEENKLIVFIITDGVPYVLNDPSESSDAFKNALLSKHKNVNVSIAACTDDPIVMKFLNEIDGVIPNVDICHNYLKEQQEVLAVQGKNFPFTVGDYLVKFLLGSIDPYFDALDEEKVDIESGQVIKKTSTLMTRTPITVVPAATGFWCFSWW